MHIRSLVCAGAASAACLVPSQAQVTQLLVDGVQADARAGQSVAGVGDFDLDGVPDVAVGSPLYTANIFLFSSDPEHGRFSIHSGVTGDEIFALTLPGSEPEGFAHLGAAVERLPGSGLFLPERVAVGSPGEVVAGERLGRVRHFVPSGFGVFAGATIDGPQAGAEFGATIASLGDVNGNGYDDWAVGAPGFAKPAPFVPAPDFGWVQVYDGFDNAPIGSPMTGSSSGARFGAAICDAGDLNGDGRPEVAVGSPEAGGGAVTVLSFGPFGWFTFDTYEADLVNEEFGGALVNVGDIDGGGEDDLAVGSPNWGVFFSGPFGRVQVFRGEDGSVAAEILGDVAGTGFGRTLAATDLDDDGVIELLVGDEPTGSDDPLPRVRAYELPGGGLVLQYLSWAIGSSGGLDAIGDTNGNGRLEFVVGLPEIEAARGGAAIVELGFAGPGGSPPPTYTVDDDGPADFSSIAQAQLFSGTGTILLVKPGQYSSFTMDRGLRIVREEGGSLFQNYVSIPRVIVRDVPSFALSGMAVDDELVIDGVAGRGSVDGTFVFGTMRVQDSSQLVMTGSTITPGIDPEPEEAGLAGLTVVGSDLALVDSAILGAQGSPSPSLGDGGAGLVVGPGSTVRVARTAISGGAGGDVIGVSPVSGGRGGPGILLDESMNLITIDGSSGDSIEGGTKDPLSLEEPAFGIDGELGTGEVLVSGVPIPSVSPGLLPAFTFSLVPRPTLEIDGAAGPGGALGIEAYGVSGGVAVVFASLGATYVEEPSILFNPLWIDFGTFFKSYVLTLVGPDAPANQPLPVPPNANLAGLCVNFQALTLEPGGLIGATNPEQVVVLF